MTDADTLYQTIVCIEPDSAHAAGNPAPDAGGQSSGQNAPLAFVQALLRESELCRESRILERQLVAWFSSAVAALEAACSVQQACAGQGRAQGPIYLRILLDRQPDWREDDAWRSGTPASGNHMQQLLQRLPFGQIFATRAIAGHLSEMAHARFRVCEPAGGAAGDLYQVICHEETITRLAVPTLNQDRTPIARNLTLRWRDETRTLTPQSPPLTIGRSDRCDLHIDSDFASRVHARLGFHGTNYILADQSTNGTFVQIEGDEEVCLHQEQIILRGRGVISLGRRILGGRGKLIYFSLSK